MKFHIWPADLHEHRRPLPQVKATFKAALDEAAPDLVAEVADEIEGPHENSVYIGLRAADGMVFVSDDGPHKWINVQFTAQEIRDGLEEACRRKANWVMRQVVAMEVYEISRRFLQS